MLGHLRQARRFEGGDNLLWGNTGFYAVPVIAPDGGAVLLPRYKTRQQRDDATHVAFEQPAPKAAFGLGNFQNAQTPAGLQDPFKLGKCDAQIADVPQRITHAQKIKMIVGKGQ